MTVRRAVMHDLGPGIYGAIARDPEQGDWLVVMSPRLSDVDAQYEIFNALMAQLDEWESRGHSTAEVRDYVRRWAG